MGLPASGSISMSQVRTELGASGAISLGQTSVRNLAGVASGPIGLSNLRGKSAYVALSGSAGSVYTDKDTQFGTGTVSAFASTNVSGGSGGNTYVWTVTSNPSSCTVSGLNTATPSVSHAYSRYQTTTFNVTLSVVVTDNTSHQITITGNTVALNVFDGRV